MKVFIGIVVGFLIPALVIGYVNWDITIITEVGGWTVANRVVYGFVSICTSILGGLFANDFM